MFLQITCSNKKRRPPMYVCLCNALKSRDVKAAVDSGARDVAEVFKACGAKPNCGRCFEEAERFLDSTETKEPEAA